jgi:hypothetical protein
MSNTIGFPRKARVPNATQWELAVARECRELCAALGAQGWDFVEIAEAIGVTRKTLYAWRLGDTDIPAAKLQQLRFVVAENVRKVGT